MICNQVLGSVNVADDQIVPTVLSPQEIRERIASLELSLRDGRRRTMDEEMKIRNKVQLLRIAYNHKFRQLVQCTFLD